MASPGAGRIVLWNVADAIVVLAGLGSEDAAAARSPREADPRIICSRVVLPDPLAPITATMPPAGTSKVRLRPDHSTGPNCADVVERQRRVAQLTIRAADTERLRQGVELGDLPAHEARLSWRDGLGHVDDGHPGLLGGRADLFGDRALGLRVVDQHVDLPTRQAAAESLEYRPEMDRTRSQRRAGSPAASCRPAPMPRPCSRRLLSVAA